MAYKTADDGLNLVISSLDSLAEVKTTIARLVLLLAGTPQNIYLLITTEQCFCVGYDRNHEIYQDIAPLTTQNIINRIKTNKLLQPIMELGTEWGNAPPQLTELVLAMESMPKDFTRLGTTIGMVPQTFEKLSSTMAQSSQLITELGAMLKRTHQTITKFNATIARANQSISITELVAECEINKAKLLAAIAFDLHLIHTVIREDLALYTKNKIIKEFVEEDKCFVRHDAQGRLPTVVEQQKDSRGTFIADVLRHYGFAHMHLSKPLETQKINELFQKIFGYTTSEETKARIYEVSSYHHQTIMGFMLAIILARTPSDDASLRPQEFLSDAINTRLTAYYRNERGVLHQETIYLLNSISTIKFGEDGIKCSDDLLQTSFAIPVTIRTTYEFIDNQGFRLKHIEYGGSPAFTLAFPYMLKDESSKAISLLSNQDNSELISTKMQQRLWNEYAVFLRKVAAEFATRENYLDKYTICKQFYEWADRAEYFADRAVAAVESKVDAMMRKLESDHKLETEFLRVQGGRPRSNSAPPEPRPEDIDAIYKPCAQPPPIPILPQPAASASESSSESRKWRLPISKLNLFHRATSTTSLPTHKPSISVATIDKPTIDNPVTDTPQQIPAPPITRERAQSFDNRFTQTPDAAPDSTPQEASKQHPAKRWDLRVIPVSINDPTPTPSPILELTTTYGDPSLVQDSAGNNKSPSSPR